MKKLKVLSGVFVVILIGIILLFIPDSSSYNLYIKAPLNTEIYTQAEVSARGVVVGEITEINETATEKIIEVEIKNDISIDRNSKFFIHKSDNLFSETSLYIVTSEFKNRLNDKDTVSAESIIDKKDKGIDNIIGIFKNANELINEYKEFKRIVLDAKTNNLSKNDCENIESKTKEVKRKISLCNSDDECKIINPRGVCPLGCYTIGNVDSTNTTLIDMLNDYKKKYAQQCTTCKYKCADVTQMDLKCIDSQCVAKFKQ